MKESYIAAKERWARKMAGKEKPTVRSGIGYRQDSDRFIIFPFWIGNPARRAARKMAAPNSWTRRKPRDLRRTKQMTHLNAIGFLMLPALFILNLGAETVTNSPVADTTLFEPNKANNLGSHTNVSAGTTREGLAARGLFRFDMAGQIPPSATVTSVSLRLVVTRVPSSGGVASVFELRRVLRPWGEGNKTSPQGGVASAGEASWNDQLKGTAPWTIPGGQIGADFSSTVSATAPVAGLGNVTFVSGPGLIADVQAWVSNAGTNFGWILMSQSEAEHETARRFASREDLNRAPQLVIDYSLGTAQCRITNISLNETTGTVV
jgi:hypothetical protein